MPLYTDEELQELIDNSHFPYVDDLDNLNKNLNKFADKIQNNFTDVIYHHKFYLNDHPATYREKAPDLTRIYFYYMKFNKKNKIVCKEYIFPKPCTPHTTHIDETEMLTQLRKLLGKARKEKIKCNESDGFQGIEWRGPSYLAFVFDEKDWDFLTKEKNDKTVICDGLHFRNLEGFSNNKTFYNAKIIEICPKKGHRKKVLICHNFHYKAPDQKPITDQNMEDGVETKSEKDTGNPRTQNHDPDRYKFDLYLKAPVCTQTSKEGKTQETIIIDPTGTNFGPP